MTLLRLLCISPFFFRRTMPDERVQVYPDIIKAGLRVLIYSECLLPAMTLTSDSN